MVDGFEVVGAVGSHASARAVMGSPIPGWNIAGVKSRCPGGAVLAVVLAAELPAGDPYLLDGAKAVGELRLLRERLVRRFRVHAVVRGSTDTKGVFLPP